MGGGGRTSRELAGRGSASTGGEGSRDGAVPLVMVTGDEVGGDEDGPAGGMGQPEGLGRWAQLSLSCTSGYRLSFCPAFLEITGPPAPHFWALCPVLNLWE